MSTKKINNIAAGIDIGSNSIRLLIAEVENNKIKEIIYQEKATTRLATNIDKTGMLAKEPFDKSIAVLAGFKKAVDKYNVKNIIFISSGGAIYGDKSIDSISEEILPNPISSYGIIKYTIEKYLYLYHKQNSINYLILRLSNPYGPYHYSEKQGVINVALRKAFANDLFYVWGNGLGAKDYIYIEDFCKIIFLLVEKPVINEVYNIGSGKSYSLNYILNCIKNKNHGFKWEYSKANDNDVKNVSLNINKLLNIIPDFNFTTLEEGLSLTSKWIKNQTRY